MSILKTKEVLFTFDKNVLSDPESFFVSEKVATSQTQEERMLNFEIKNTTEALFDMTGKWNAAIMFLLEKSGWEFVSKLLVYLYEHVGRRTLRLYIDFSLLIGDMSRSPLLASHLETYKAAGFDYNLEIVDASMDSLIAGYISRCQFMAIVRHVTSEQSAFIGTNAVSVEKITKNVDRILTTAALYKPRYHAEFVSMLSLIEYDVPWIADRDSYLLFTGKKKTLKRNRVSWGDDNGVLEEVLCSPEKRLRVDDLLSDEYFSDSLPSDDVLSEDVDHLILAQF